MTGRSIGVMGHPGGHGNLDWSVGAAVDRDDFDAAIDAGSVRRRSGRVTAVGGTGHRRKQGGQLTLRDLGWLTWIAGHRAVTANQLLAHSGLRRQSKSKIYDRTRYLGAIGYLGHETKGVPGPVGVYWATKAGLEVAGLQLRRTGPPDAATVHHDLEVVDVAVALELSGWSVTTERVMIHEEGSIRRGEPADYVVWQPGAQPTRGRHFADLLIERDGSREAVEIERSGKDRARLIGIFRAYLEAPHIDRVRYLVSGKTQSESRLLLRKLVRIRDEVGGVGKILIRPLPEKMNRRAQSE